MTAVHPGPAPEAAPEADQQTSPTEQEPLAEQPTQQHGLWAKCRPWVLTPGTVRQWLVFLATWGSIIGGLSYLFVWGFPKLVDSVINPCIDRLQERMSPVQLGVLVIVGAWFFPVFIIPKDPFVWLAALVFPLPIALLLVEIADVLTITTTFWLGRTLLQQLALRFLHRYKRAAAVLKAVKQAGQFKVVLLLSLGPVPKLATHYLISFPTDITFWPALLASFLGCLPGNALGVVFGHNITGLSDLLKGHKIPTAQLIYIIVSLSAAIIMVVLFFWYAKRALREIEAEAERREKAECEAGAASEEQLQRDEGQLEQPAKTDLSIEPLNHRASSSPISAPPDNMQGCPRGHVEQVMPAVAVLPKI